MFVSQKAVNGGSENFNLCNSTLSLSDHKQYQMKLIFPQEKLMVLHFLYFSKVVSFIYFVILHLFIFLATQKVLIPKVISRSTNRKKKASD